MSGTRRSRKQGSKTKSRKPPFISNRISALFGDSMTNAKKALLAMGPAAALALRSSPRKNVNKPSTTKRVTGPAGKRTNIRRKTGPSGR